jgi:pSer/pThr/pTyr-binding forkhead associated (FHA) protein
MEAVIWVEILSRHRDVASRHRCAGAEIRIGRGYDNDVIVDDPYVAVQHLRVFRDDSGQIVAEDIGSANGLFLEDARQRVQRVIVDGERPIRIGHTYLRLRGSHHTVPRERVPERRRVWPIARIALLALATLGIEAGVLWLAEVTEPKLWTYLRELLTIAAEALLWGGCWAIVTRIFAGRARFERNLLIGIVACLALLLYRQFAELAAFALSWRLPIAYEYAAPWLVLAAAAFLSLRAMSPTRLWLKGAIVVALLALAVGTESVYLAEARADIGQQSYLARLFPPALRLAPLQPADAFFAKVEEMRAELDNDRNAPAEGGR